MLAVLPGGVEGAASLLEYFGDSFKFSFNHVNSGDNNVLNSGEIIDGQLILSHLLT